MRPQRSLTAFADPSRQLATFQRRSHRRGILLLKAHSHRFANQTRQPRGRGGGGEGGKSGRRGWLLSSSLPVSRRNHHGNPFFKMSKIAQPSITRNYPFIINFSHNIYIYLFFKIALEFKTSFDFIIVFVVDATRRRFFEDETSFFREVIRSLSVWSLSFFFFLFIFVIDTVSFENAGRICRVFTRKGGTFS